MSASLSARRAPAPQLHALARRAASGSAAGARAAPRRAAMPCRAQVRTPPRTRRRTL
jgi:hypothetical protein